MPLLDEPPKQVRRRHAAMPRLAVKPGLKVGPDQEPNLVVELLLVKRHLTLPSQARARRHPKPGVDFGFKVRLADFEESKRYG
jgi:hypothetical protein